MIAAAKQASPVSPGPERGDLVGFCAMTVTRSILLFILAAVAEIGGAWLIWQGLREHRGWIWMGAGVIALGLYGFVATLQPDAHFGPDPGRLRRHLRRRIPGLGHGARRLPARPMGHHRSPDLPGRRRHHHVRATQRLTQRTKQ